MSKRPAFMFYTGDWLKDPCLSMCSPQTRGIWIDAMCAMHESDSGTLTGTPDQLARVLRCSPSDVLSAIGELKATKTAEIRESHGNVTLVSRRMQREAKDRENERLRQKRKRCHAPVTQVSRDCHTTSSYSSSYSSSNTPPSPPAGGVDFSPIWDAVPALHSAMSSRNLEIVEGMVRMSSVEAVADACRIAAEKTGSARAGPILAYAEKVIAGKQAAPVRKTAREQDIEDTNKWIDSLTFEGAKP